MNYEEEITKGCSEEFAELCALSTTGELRAEESGFLDEHLAHCPSCTALLRDYTSLAQAGMAKLAPLREEEIKIPFGYNENRAEKRYTAAFEELEPRWQPQALPYGALLAVPNNRRALIWIGTAAALFACIGGAFEAGRTTATSQLHSQITLAKTPSAAAQESRNTQLQAELSAAKTSLDTIATKSVGLERQVSELSDAKTKLAAQISDLTTKGNGDAALLVTATQQRDLIQQQLTEATALLDRTREDLSQAQQERQGAVYRVATLEREVSDLNTQLTHSSNWATGDEKLLVADRDIRELMGARQLYIADVFDVQNNGERSKPFGRIFYTNGKSLIFYAFDLDKQPGYRETKAFQAWGKPGDASAKPISLGIFYMDNEQNRRWVVKSDKPEVLVRINAVFVTVEPHGGSRTPTTKPLLEAYLHSLPPNHP